MMAAGVVKSLQIGRSGAFGVWTLTALLYAPPLSAAGDRALGEYLSSECVTCHQLSGQSQGIPPIVGRPDSHFVEAMNEYRSKRRDNAIMQTIAGKFSDAEIEALAAYFGSMKPRDTKTDRNQRGRR